MSVADRVAVERGEDLGSTVGYQIRLESKGGPNSSLVFCTNGVLMRMVTGQDRLAGITHVVCDEIHERDKFADFLLIMLRDILSQNPGLRLVLMSATLHTGEPGPRGGRRGVVSAPRARPGRPGPARVTARVTARPGPARVTARVTARRPRPRARPQSSSRGTSTGAPW